MPEEDVRQLADMAAEFGVPRSRIVAVAVRELSKQTSAQIRKKLGDDK